MNIIFFDDISRRNLLPLTFTRPVADLRVGILRISEKWKKLTGFPVSFITETYLTEKFSCQIMADNLLINGAIVPGRDLASAVTALNTGEALVMGNRLLACRLNEGDAGNFQPASFKAKKERDYSGTIRILDHPWQIFSWNGEAITEDYHLVTTGRHSLKLSRSNNILAEENIFVEEGVRAEFSTINASTGPVYLGKDSEIMEGSVIRGPFSLGEHSTVKLSAKIYGPTTIGPHSKAGGEINNCVIQGYSNKAHDGFLGNSVLGEWCNIGADTNNSNLKNNYAKVKVWNYDAEKFITTDLLFCGLIMGDHSKCGINTMFNTGTVVGVSANIFGSGFPRAFIPSFSWGGAHGFSTFSLQKAFEVAEQVMGRRNIPFDETEKKILSEVFTLTARYRN